MDISYLNSLSAPDVYFAVDRFFDKANDIRKSMLLFTAFTGQYGRLDDKNGADIYNNYSSELCGENAFLSTTSREAANLTYAQLWSNDNESIVLENVDNDVYDKFIQWLNKTNLSAAISNIIKDYIDYGFCFLYVEETSKDPYIHFKVLNPLSIAWSQHDNAYFHKQFKYNKQKQEWQELIHVVTPEDSYFIDNTGRKAKSTLKFKSFINIKPDCIFNAAGVGLSLSQAVCDLQSTVNAWQKHMAMHVQPPVVVNAHTATQDDVIDLEPSGVTKLAEHYAAGSTGTPVAMVLDKYHNVLKEIQIYLEQQRNDIQKAYRIDMLQSQDPTIRSSAYQLLRTQLYYVFIPKLVDATAAVFKRRMKLDLGKDYVLKFDTLANNASTASKANNMTEFLNLVGMVEKINGGSGLKLNPSKLIEEIGDILKIDPFVLFSEKDMAGIMHNIAAQNQGQAPVSQQPSAVQPNLINPKLVQ